MNNKYKVITKSGTEISAKNVEHHMGFVIISSRRGERRIPAGEVAEIRSYRGERFMDKFVTLYLPAIVFVITFLVVIEL